MSRITSKLLLVVLLGWPAVAHSAPQCLSTDNMCEPDKLCTFKAAYFEKVFIYRTYLRNSQKTKRDGRREGIRYRGTLYDASVAESRQALPNGSAAEQRVKAGDIFQDKVRSHVQQNYRDPPCRLGGQVKLELLPKAGYTGMSTNAACQIHVSYQGGDYDPAGFGANDTTNCKEFYDRDIAHEIIHQTGCKDAQRRGDTTGHEIDKVIEDEISAYRHSVLLSKAYVRLLSILCSASAPQSEVQSRAQQVQQLLEPYLANGGG